jgi:hypothetical protein
MSMCTRFFTTFWFGYSLERNMWRVRILLMKIHELRWTPQPALDFDPENQLPKGGESLRIRCVDLYPTETTNPRSLVAHNSLPAAPTFGRGGLPGVSPRWRYAAPI